MYYMARGVVGVTLEVIKACLWYYCSIKDSIGMVYASVGGAAMPEVVVTYTLRI